MPYWSGEGRSGGNEGNFDGEKKITLSYKFQVSQFPCQLLKITKHKIGIYNVRWIPKDL